MNIGFVFLVTLATLSLSDSSESYDADQKHTSVDYNRKYESQDTTESPRTAHYLPAGPAYAPQPQKPGTDYAAIKNTRIMPGLNPNYDHDSSRPPKDRLDYQMPVWYPEYQTPVNQPRAPSDFGTLYPTNMPIEQKPITLPEKDPPKEELACIMDTVDTSADRLCVCDYEGVERCETKLELAYRKRLGCINSDRINLGCNECRCGRNGPENCTAKKCAVAPKRCTPGKTYFVNGHSCICSMNEMVACTQYFYDQMNAFI
jgi:hypothetical protein